jgi:tripartite-type tricarboxylate transporter receptor subunit TctC
MREAMKLQRRQLLHLAAGVAALTALFAIVPAGSQSARTIKIIVPLAPGGGADILARLLVEHIGRTQRVGVVVENRAGAGSVIGSEAVSRALPDGNTLLINTPNLVIGAHLRKLSYDPTAVLAEYPAVAEQIGAGKLRALATGSPTRIEPLPEFLTVAESGYPGFEVDVWWGVFAPALTPKEIVSRLAASFASAVQAPEIKAKLFALGFYPVGVCGADFAAYLRREYDEYGRVIREGNIKDE